MKSRLFAIKAYNVFFCSSYINKKFLLFAILQEALVHKVQNVFDKHFVT